MFRLNAQMTTEAAIVAGGGVPGGTGAVIFIDTATSNTLKAVGPDGTVYKAVQVDGTNDIRFIAD